MSKRYWKQMSTWIWMACVVGIAVLVCWPIKGESLEYSQFPSCLMNLQHIETAKAQAYGTVEKGGVLSDESIDEWIKGGEPTCPGGGSYKYGAELETAFCNEHGVARPVPMRPSSVVILIRLGSVLCLLIVGTICFVTSRRKLRQAST